MLSVLAVHRHFYSLMLLWLLKVIERNFKKNNSGPNVSTFLSSIFHRKVFRLKTCPRITSITPVLPIPSRRPWSCISRNWSRLCLKMYTFLTLEFTFIWKKLTYLKWKDWQDLEEHNQRLGSGLELWLKYLLYLKNTYKKTVLPILLVQCCVYFYVCLRTGASCWETRVLSMRQMYTKSAIRVKTIRIYK